MKFLSLFILFFSLGGFAQQPDIEIFDLYVVPILEDLETDSLDQADSIKIKVAFKVENLIEADSIFFKSVSGSPATAQLLNYKVLISPIGDYYLSNGLSTVQFYGRNLYLLILCSKLEFNELEYFELWGKDKNGVYTTAIRFNFS